MSIENVKAFFKRIEEDEAFRNEFAQNRAIEKGSQDSLLKAAADAGYPFGIDELKQVKSEPLTDEQLTKVSGGGLSWGGCIYLGFAQDLTDYDGDSQEIGFCIVYGITS